MAKNENNFDLSGPGPGDNIDGFVTSVVTERNHRWVENFTPPTEEYDPPERSKTMKLFYKILPAFEKNDDRHTLTQDQKFKRLLLAILILLIWLGIFIVLPILHIG